MIIFVYRKNYKIYNKYKVLKYIIIYKVWKNCIVYVDLWFVVLLYDFVIEFYRLYIYDFMYLVVFYV